MKKMDTQFWAPKNKDKWQQETQWSNDAHKNVLKEEILQVITENFMEMCY
jgi:hypothetical protein